MTKGVAVATDQPIGAAMPFSRHLTRTARLVGICGIILEFDGMQAVPMGALRGACLPLRTCR